MTVEPAVAATIRSDVSPAALRAAIVDDLERSAVRRRLLPGERVVRTPTLLAYLSDLRSADANEVVRARFGSGAGAEVDAAIEETIARFDGRPFLWWVGPDDEPADLSDRLRAHDVAFLDDIPGMAMDLADLEAEGPEAGLPPGLTIAPVLDRAALDAFHAVLSHGFPEDFVDEPTDAALAAASLHQAEESAWREPDGLPTRWLASLDGRPVTTTRIHTGAGVAGLYAVVTIDDARRQGFGEAITRHVLREARAAGHRIAVLQASTAGRGVYERIGFREHCRFRLHEHRGRPPA